SEEERLEPGVLGRAREGGHGPGTPPPIILAQEDSSHSNCRPARRYDLPPLIPCSNCLLVRQVRECSCASSPCQHRRALRPRLSGRSWVRRTRSTDAEAAPL